MAKKWEILIGSSIQSIISKKISAPRYLSAGQMIANHPSQRAGDALGWRSTSVQAHLLRNVPPH